MPFPWNENVPAVPASIDAEKMNRDDVDFAVLLAALATGSSDRVSWAAQPVSKVAQSTTQSSGKKRRGLISPSDRRRPRELLSLEWGERGAPGLGVRPERGCT